MIFIIMVGHARAAVIPLTDRKTWSRRQRTGPISSRRTRASQAHGSWPLTQLQA
jgi:hypothetical protein